MAMSIIFLLAGHAGQADAQTSSGAATSEAARAPAQAADTAPPTSDAPAPAAPASSGLGDIVVTAERRASNVQSTPIAISAVDGNSLRSRGVTNIEGLNQSVPNLSFSRNAGDAKIFIRGIGYNSISPGGETRVALYDDGVYQSRTQAGLLSFYDVDRVEVLRGPQGTLYGRNAIAGTINIITRDPGSELGGYFTGTAGNYGLVGTEGAVGGPITGDLEGRVAFKTVDHGGYGHNISTGEPVDDEHTHSVRGKLKWTPASNLTFRLEGDYTNENDHSGGYRLVAAGNPDIVPVGIARGGTVPDDKQDAAGFGPRNKISTYGTALQVDWALSDRTKLTSMSGFRHLVQNIETNNDGTTSYVNLQYITERSNTFSQELRISQNFGSFADLIIGGYYFHEHNIAFNQVPFAGYLLGEDPTKFYEGYATYGAVSTDAEAIFAQANIHLAPKLELDVGGRYSHERKRINESAQLDLADIFSPTNPIIPYGADRQQESASSFDPKVTLSYKPADRLYLYATYSRGFKAGGFNIGGLQPPFKPEKLTDYEVGVKADFFNRHLRTNIAAFYYDYKQLQVNITEGLALVTRNAAAARVKGIEAEVTALPIDDLRFTVNAAYLDAKYRKFTAPNPAIDPDTPLDLAGHTLDDAPKYKIDTELGYTLHTSAGDFTPRVNVTWTGKIYFTEFNTRDSEQPARTELNLYVDWALPGKGWSFAAYLKNATNKTYVVSAALSAGLFGYPVVGQYGPPRTVGVSVTKTF